MVNMNSSRADDDHVNPDDYIEYYAETFSRFCELSNGRRQGKKNDNYVPLLSVDCANGVGTIPLEKVSNLIKEWIKIDLYNYDIDNPQKLNEECGAEYVHKSQMKPTNMPEAE